MEGNAPEPPRLPAGGVSRRGALKALLLAGSGVLAAAGSVLFASIARFFFPNEPSASPPVFRAGRPEDFREGEVRWDLARRHRVFLVRENGILYALSATCTHLGCTTVWMQAEEKFKCPCHGSGFRKSGANFEGPALRPLPRFRIVLGEDGQVLVDKRRTFLKEKGQWAEPESFLDVGGRNG